MTEHCHIEKASDISLIRKQILTEHYVDLDLFFFLVHDDRTLNLNSQRLNFLNGHSQNFHSAVVGVEDDVRVCLLDDDLEVVSIARIHRRVGREFERASVIVKAEERREILVSHSSNLDLRLVVSFLIDKLRQLVREALIEI